MKIVDFSRELYHRTPSYPGHPPVVHGVWKCHEEPFAEAGNVHGLQSMFISMPDHAGDLRHIAPRAEIAASNLEQAVKKASVPVPKGGTVLLCTGHHEPTARARNMRPTIPA